MGVAPGRMMPVKSHIVAKGRIFWCPATLSRPEQMARGDRKAKRMERRSKRTDVGRVFARLLCLLFALVGLVPLSGGVLMRSAPMKKWAASETSRLLREQLGVSASFNVEMSLIPLRLAITDLKVPSTDGGSPAVSTRLAAVSPRFFSLLAGRLDVGDIEFEDTAVRLVIEDGQVKNVAYRFPETQDGEPPELTRSPFRSLAVTNAQLDLLLDGTHLKTRGIDIDTFAEPNLSFDLAVRAAGATLDRTRKTPDGLFYDEDRLCALDLRAYLSKDTESVTIRRLAILGAADLDPAQGTRPDCDEQLEPGKDALANLEKVAIRLSQVKVNLNKPARPVLRGHVMARAPAPLANRFGNMPTFHGWAGFSGEVAFDGTGKMPEISGEVSGAGVGMDKYTFAHKLEGTVRITGDVIQVPELHLLFGNGEAHVERLRIEPFAEKMPMRVGSVRSTGVDFPGLMRDMGVTEDTIVDWNFGEMDVTDVAGTLKPFYIDGRVAARTHDFVVWNRAYHEPARQRMIGVQRASIDGRFRVHTRALEFYDSLASFGNSKLPVDLVSIGFRNHLIVRLDEGAELDLADVSPIAGLDVAGVTRLQVNLDGPAVHPPLDGTISVDGLSIGGFEAGDLHHSKVHFEPLYVDFSEAQGKKGDMTYTLPSARLSFDGPAGVEFTASVKSDQFVVQEFLEIFHFDRDPRFSEISGTGKTEARIRYLMGGPEDVCDGGRLFVDGETDMNDVALFGETYNGGNARFTFEWFDMKAGAAGMRLSVPSVALQKGTGSVFGSAEVRSGGRLDGTFVATRLPISKIDALGTVVDRADGYVSGTGHVSNTLDALAFSADVQVTEIKAGSSTLPPSHVSVRLEPAATPAPRTAEKTACGRPVAGEYDASEHEKDDADGTFHVNGSLFGGQIRLANLSITSQRDRVVRGQASLHRLDLGALSAFSPEAALEGPLVQGSLSGEIELEQYFVARPFDSDAHVGITQADLTYGGFEVKLAEQGARLTLADGALRSENLALAALTPSGQRGVVDVNFRLDGQKQIESDLVLRETSLGVLAPALPGVERAEGRLAAHFHLTGPVLNPTLTGKVTVDDGKLAFESFATPVTNLDLTVVLEGSRLYVQRGTAGWGGGRVWIDGSAPLHGATLGRVELGIKTRKVALPLDKDVRLAFDSDLRLVVPARTEGKEALPRLSGTVDLLSLKYEKPMNVTADITDLTGRGKKSEVETYDAEKDVLAFDVLVRSSHPIEVSNNLVETDLLIDPAGLRISGTNQRLGAVGAVEIPPGGRILLRQNEFEIQRGLVRFNDPTKLSPEIDVAAVTEYRRYEDRGATTGAATASTGTGTPASGNWRIHLHAYGQPDDIQVDLTSDPPLAQDDIFLLLAVGLTRTELDQTQNTGVGSSVALEALGSLSGAESAVTETVPIDEFRFGSTWSSRTGRTEPTVTIGKRLSERIRASVTTSLSDANEVRSNVEYRATRNLSLEGSYDNAQNSGSTTVGNIGGDVRWRLEFE